LDIRIINFLEIFHSIAFLLLVLFSQFRMADTQHSVYQGRHSLHTQSTLPLQSFTGNTIPTVSYGRYSTPIHTTSTPPSFSDFFIFAALLVTLSTSIP